MIVTTGSFNYKPIIKTALVGGLVSSLIETAVVNTVVAPGSAGNTTINYDINTQSVLYFSTNATANWTLNIRYSTGTSLNSALATGQSATFVMITTSGGTAYYNNAITIDGVSVTPKYQGGTAWSAGNINSWDVYTYTAIKTGPDAYVLLASQTQFA
jgi:hypothetical protein